MRLNAYPDFSAVTFGQLPAPQVTIAPEDALPQILILDSGKFPSRLF